MSLHSLRYTINVATQDVEQGLPEQSEKSFLLPHRRTSSFDEDLETSVSRAHSRTLPQPSKEALGVSAAPEASTSGIDADAQGTDNNKLKGLGLAGISTVFQAVMSVCAKILGQFISASGAVLSCNLLITTKQVLLKLWRYTASTPNHNVHSMSLNFISTAKVTCGACLQL